MKRASSASRWGFRRKEKQDRRELRTAATARQSSSSSSMFWIMSRLFYCLLATICYSILSTVWEHHPPEYSASSSSSLLLLRQYQQEDRQLHKNETTTTTRATTTTASSSDKVAFVVTITGCGDDRDIPFQIVEGAAVLRHSIHQNSIHGGQGQGGRYDYQLYAFYHPDAAACAPVLQDLGYTVQQRDTPVAVSDIQGDVLRERIVHNGCCGEKELIKFEAYTLTQHKVVVLLDLDVLVLKPLDRLFDFILDSSRRPHDDDLLLRPNDVHIPSRIDLLYTTDYAMVAPGRKYKPTQGGFVILRPSMETYNEFVEIVKIGDFRDTNGTGWGGVTGKFWGGMSFQGLMPYYYQVLHPGRAVELNWCVWNNMCSPSRDQGVVKDKPVGECLTQQEDCEDCRNRPVEQVGLTHFTVCQKPWTCSKWAQDNIDHRLCRALHHEWFKVRSEMEKSWGRSGWGNGTFDREQFFGYCKRFGTKGYQAMAKPYGAPAVAALDE